MSFTPGAGTRFLVSTGASGTTPLSGPLSITGGTATANTPVLSATQTWNNAAVTFTGWQLNVTDTASNAASLLLNLQVGGIGRFSVRKDGQLSFNGDLVINPNDINIRATAANGVLINLTGVSIGEQSAIFFRDVPSGTIYSALRATVSGVIEQRNGVNAQTLRVYNTFTDASNYERGIFSWASNVLTIGTEAAGTGLSRTLELRTAGLRRITILPSGEVAINSATAPAGIFYANSGSANTVAAFQSTSGRASIALADGATATWAVAPKIGVTNLTLFVSTNNADRMFVDGNGNVVINTAAIATNATDGFLYVPGCAGLPTGTPTAYTGRVPIVVDTTNNKLYFYSGGAWRDAGP